MEVEVWGARNHSASTAFCVSTILFLRRIRLPHLTRESQYSKANLTDDGGSVGNHAKSQKVHDVCKSD